MAGYSGKSLVAKLGIKAGWRVYPKNAPVEYVQLVGPLPNEVTLLAHPAANIDMAHLFTKEADSLAFDLRALRERIKPDGVIWVSWPKKASKLATNVTEDVVRKMALPLDLVDVKVCAVDETWSALKLVIRVESRSTSGRVARANEKSP